MTDTDSNHHTTPEAELWPMGAVTRRTGISEHTLRAWERRFGFPKPLRLPSGHRRYTMEHVRQLLLINKALRCGYRAGDVVSLPKERIEALVRESHDSAAGPEGQALTRRWVEEILDDALAFDEASIRARLSSHAAALGVRGFLRDRAAPLIDELGEAWSCDDIGIRHEHFVSEILDNHLSALRQPFEDSSGGRPVVLACLPDELHGLGLQMVAAEIAAAGRRTRVLGPDTPLDEIVATADSLDAAAVGLSVSAFAPPDRSLEMITALRRDLPKTTHLWIGGRGAEAVESLPRGIRCHATLDDVAEAVRDLSD